MPISPVAEYPASHWNEVREILRSSIESSSEYDYRVFLVSDADNVGLIHKRIVQNVYDCEIVVCDVSSKNPNVMFELGMRLAFDKPTVIIKDDQTGYSFDTGVVEHLEYPADLRYSKINDFRESLARKVDATYRLSLDGGEDASFLKSFGRFSVRKLDEEHLTGQDAIVQLMLDLQSEVIQLRSAFLQQKSEISSPVRSASRVESAPSLSSLITQYYRVFPKEERGVVTSKLLEFISKSAVRGADVSEVAQVLARKFDLAEIQIRLSDES
ncbi:MAG: hypothetical protein EOP06_10710 [Proteobacteria bacterium]|nr:MAG: hypothetical protein EOP06_10710 [Pseudomonadota bacterium]